MNKMKAHLPTCAVAILVGEATEGGPPSVRISLIRSHLSSEAVAHAVRVGMAPALHNQGCAWSCWVPGTAKFRSPEKALEHHEVAAMLAFAVDPHGAGFDADIVNTAWSSLNTANEALTVEATTTIPLEAAATAEEPPKPEEEEMPQAAGDPPHGGIDL